MGETREGWMKKLRIDRCFDVARRSRARGDARNDASVGWMDG